MRIAFFEIENWEQKIIEQKLNTHSLIFSQETYTAETAKNYPEIEILSTFIYSQLSSAILSLLPKLKLIVTRSTGYDHIDLSYCKERNITVCNVPTYGVNTIAEHTFALTLTLSRKIIPSVEHTRRGDFRLDDLSGFELAGKTIGVIGFGHIGKRVVELARAFRMNVLVTTRHPDETLAQKWNIQFVDLPTLLQTSDIVSIHVSLTSETTHLINTENILHMKKGAILVNTARGAIVETEAILLALEKGILAGAGLDVLEEECTMKEERELLTKEFLKTCDLKTQLLNHVLLTKDNVIITPHNAFNSHEALIQILDTTVTNITAWSNGKVQNNIT